MLIAYFDESFEHRKVGDELLQVSLGGCIATEEAWACFVPEWAAVLPPGMDMFHMTDFENRRDVCRDWVQERRNAFLNNLLDIMGRHIIQFCGFSAHVDFADISGKKRFREGYRDSLVSAIFEISGIAKAIGEDKISMVFSNQRDFKLGAIENLLSEIGHEHAGIVSVSMKDPRCVSPLQAADIMAFETRCYHRSQAKIGYENRRYPLGKLGDHGKGMALEWALKTQERQGLDARLRFSAREAFKKLRSEP